MIVSILQEEISRLESLNRQEAAKRMACVTAYALCWPGDDRPLLFRDLRVAEENRIWFSKNYKTDRDGSPRGEPYIVELTGFGRQEA